MIRDRVATPPAAVPLLLPLLLLLPVVLFDTGALPGTVAVALAATAAAGSALVARAVLASRCAPAAPPTRVRTAVRDRDRRTASLPQRDPGAAGRPRPRAPGRALPATTV
ncbi:DUF6412 domain-containing protein [Streptomyces sp. NPDC001292]|uniref:DUF6412 domain-containing protein n=1 Tax=Streptomyces sp. NPDC001292 TaxID=3364558 RepID=UPI0036938C1A